MKDRTLVEVCCSSLNSVLTAQSVGADRIELCRDLRLDGLTPDDKLLDEVFRQATLPIHVLIRPRAGDFHYTLSELAEIESQISMAMEYPISGIVVGHLSEEMRPDSVVLREWREMTKGLELTFHRAFDRVKDPFEVLVQLAEEGFNRVLTSGQAQSAHEGIEHLIELKSVAENSITVMPGGGIQQFNARSFVKRKFEAIHLSAKSPDLPKVVEPVVNEEILRKVVKIVRG